jgi:hypothetical protein
MASLSPAGTRQLLLTHHNILLWEIALTKKQGAFYKSSFGKP